MKITIELDSSGTQQPEIKKEYSTEMEQPSINMAATFSTSSINAGAAPSTDGYISPTGGNATSSALSPQGSVPISMSGALDGGSAKALQESLPMAIPDMNAPGAADQGSAYSPGAFVNIETHHN
jgi:hypothetical protein